MIRLVYNSAAARRRDLDEEALAWVVKLTSGESHEEDHESFRRWRDQSADHKAALVRARALWNQLGDTLPKIERKRARKATFYRKIVPLAASLLLTAHVGTRYWNDWRFDQVTGVGEQRVVNLADGSRMIMGGDTALKLDFRKGLRRIDVARGEAQFEVRHDPSLPFVVHAAGGEIRDIGTVFDVSVLPEGARVVVQQGIVEASIDDRRTVLTANQSVVVSPESVQNVRTVDAAAETAWTRGRLILNDKPLSEILAAIRPYHEGKIILLNREAGHQMLSAVIDLKHVDDWLAALETRHSVRITRVAGVTFLT